MERLGLLDDISGVYGSGLGAQCGISIACVLWSRTGSNEHLTVSTAMCRRVGA